MTDLVALWEQLEGESSNPGVLKRLIDPYWVGELSAAVVKPSNERALVLELAEPIQMDPDELSASNSFDLVTAGTSDGVTSLQLQLTDIEFRDTFALMAEDVAKKILLTKTESDGAHSFVQGIGRWLRFLKRRNVKALNRRKRVGLYGELTVLHEVLSPLISADAAIRAWMGPLGQYQDFHLPGIAVEVKTISATAPQTLKIETERQLDDTGFEALVLAHLSVDVRNGTGRTLPELVQTIRESLSSQSAIEEFEDRLFEYGYTEGHAHLYANEGFVSRETSYYRVRDGFPRIIERDLLPGLGSVRYAIDASACDPFSIEQTRLEEWIRDAPPEADPVLDEESLFFEKKASVWTATDDRPVSPKELSVATVKTIAALLNSHGGTLAIGVSDRNSEVVGIELDLDALKIDRDAYEVKLATLLVSSLGGPAATRCAIEYQMEGDKTICLVKVAASPRPVWANPPFGEKGIFWARISNSTKRLDGSDLVQYIRDNWG